MLNRDVLEIENLKTNKNTCTIRWQITELCNYGCDFCIQGSKEQHVLNSKGESAEIRNIICDKIINFIEKDLTGKFNEVRIYLIGGEITILKEFIPILDKLVNTHFSGKISIHITTNLSCSKSVLTTLKKIFNKNKNRALVLSASYYKSFTDLSTFVKKIRCLGASISIPYRIIRRVLNKEKKITVGISYPLITDEDYIEYLKFKKKYKTICDSINYIIIRNYKKSVSDKLKKELSITNKENIKVKFVTGEERYYTNISKLGLDLEDTKVFNPRGYWCDSGIYSISINSIGLVSRCPSCLKESKICNLLDDELQLSEKKFKCPARGCYCNYYYKIEKNK